MLWILRFAGQFLCEHETSADRQSPDSRAQEIRHTFIPNVKTKSEAELWGIKRQRLAHYTLVRKFYFNLFPLMTIWKLLMLLKVSEKISRFYWTKVRSRIIIRCIQASGIRGTTPALKCSASGVSCNRLSWVLCLLPSLSEYYLLFQRFAITIISITSCQPDPKRRNATRNEKSLSIISICWQLTAPWHFNVNLTSKL